MTKLYSLAIRGRKKSWGFRIEADPRHVEDWRADGLELSEIVNTIPVWVVNLGLLRPYIILQDLFYMRNPWKR